MEKRFKTLLESQMGDVKPLVLEQEVEEGSRWQGIKGWFKGKGYYYSRYLNDIKNMLEDLNKKVVTDDNLRSQIDELVGKIQESSMEDPKKDELLDQLSMISETMENANQEIKNHLAQIRSMAQ